jgi:hypothetical protein
VTHDPLTAVLLVTFIDTVGYYPTFRKAYYKPSEEIAYTRAISNLKHASSICAISVYSLTTVFYPTVMFLSNSAFITMLLWRRASLARA